MELRRLHEERKESIDAVNRLVVKRPGMANPNNGNCASPRPMLSRHYRRVQDRISPEGFDAKVKAKVQEWGGLLDKDAASLLVLEEMGVDVADWTPIAGFEDNAEVSVRATVAEVTEVREFSRRDGSQGRVVNAVLRDATGTCRLTLWDDDVDLVASGKLRAGSMVRVLDGYVRQTRYGLELSRGKFGTVLIE